jgi:hypothetical protein
MARTGMARAEGEAVTGTWRRQHCHRDMGSDAVPFGARLGRAARCLRNALQPFKLPHRATYGYGESRFWYWAFHAAVVAAVALGIAYGIMLAAYGDCELPSCAPDRRNRLRASVLVGFAALWGLICLAVFAAYVLVLERGKPPGGQHFAGRSGRRLGWHRDLGVRFHDAHGVLADPAPAGGAPPGGHFTPDLGCPQESQMGGARRLGAPRTLVRRTA